VSYECNIAAATSDPDGFRAAIAGAMAIRDDRVRAVGRPG
jgi:hypothetical protein